VLQYCNRFNSWSAFVVATTTWFHLSCQLWSRYWCTEKNCSPGCLIECSHKLCNFFTKSS